MRYIIKPKKIIKPGDTREKAAFLLFPKKIGNEIRWLEKARWLEVYSEYCSELKSCFNFHGWATKWIAVKWLLNDNEAYN